MEELSKSADDLTAHLVDDAEVVRPANGIKKQNDKSTPFLCEICSLTRCINAPVDFFRKKDITTEILCRLLPFQWMTSTSNCYHLLTLILLCHISKAHKHEILLFFARYFFRVEERFQVREISLSGNTESWHSSK